MSVDTKVRENRLRRAAERQGLQLQKSRRRDPSAIDFEHYCLIDIYTSGLAHESAPWGAYALTLDEVEKYLSRSK